MTMRRFENPWFDKPPLYFWSAIAIEKVIPDKEFAYRLPSALSGILSIILTMLIVYTAAESYLAASIAGGVALTSPMFLYAGRQLRMDVPVTAAILFTIFSFLKGLKDERWYAGVGVGIALGIMMKSVIGLLPLGFIAIFAFIHRNTSFFKSVYLWIGIAAMFVIAAPWHIYESVKFGSVFWDSYLFHLVIQRVGENILGGIAPPSNSVEYFNILLTWAQPWTTLFVLFIPVVWWMYRKGETVRDTFVFLLFPIGVLCIFLLAKTKLGYYLMPIYPFIAIFVALTTYWLFQRIRKRALRITALVVGVVLFIGGFANTIYVGYNYADNEQLIANEERNLGAFLNANPAPKLVYTYYWDYWDTIWYYGNGRVIQQMKDGQPIDSSFFLVMHSGYTYHFPPWFSSRLDVVYKGAAMTVYKFTYTPPRK